MMMMMMMMTMMMIGVTGVSSGQNVKHFLHELS